MAGKDQGGGNPREGMEGTNEGKWEDRKVDREIDEDEAQKKKEIADALAKKIKKAQAVLTTLGPDAASELVKQFGEIKTLSSSELDTIIAYGEENAPTIENFLTGLQNKKLELAIKKNAPGIASQTSMPGVREQSVLNIR